MIFHENKNVQSAHSQEGNVESGNAQSLCSHAVDSDLYEKDDESDSIPEVEVVINGKFGDWTAVSGDTSGAMLLKPVNTITPAKILNVADVQDTSNSVYKSFEEFNTLSFEESNTLVSVHNSDQTQYASSIKMEGNVTQIIE